ncbi:ubiquitin protein ligase [Aureococcus anophagefferens]|nr:ubiquitin protein ligase [Aureococcus anophagefferens]
MGCGRSRDVEAARDAPSEPPPLPDLAPMAELEALLAEAVRLGMLDRRGGAETRQRVVDGELALDAVRNTWREILGFDDAPLTGDEVEVLVASAHDDLTSASDDDSSDGDVAADGGEALLKNDVRRLSFLRNLTSRGRVQWDGTELAPPGEDGWVPYAVLSCGKFGLGVFRPDDAGRPAAARGCRPRRAPRVPLSSKLGVLKAACQSLAVPWEDGHIQVILRRETAARDALDLAAALPARDFWKTWRFDIADEPGMDAGGLARECWALIAAGVLDPESKYWRFAATDNVTLQIRPPRDPAAFSPEDAKHYRVAGRLVAKALFDGQTIPAHLNRPMLKHLLAMPVTFSDLEAVDLGPGGADRDVDASNKDEYVARLFKFAMLDVVSKPLGKFLKGFYEVLPLAALNAAAFDPGDLELAIAGLDDVDVGDWRAHTEYSQGYDDDDPAGRDGVTKGFELRRRPGGDKAFPVAHTWFNRLDLPAYSDVAVLARILSAILEGDVLGFSGD